jgi:uncharacterized protein with PhoU and TrkA domain
MAPRADEEEGVLGTLVEMRSVSELMVDLAYTALLQDDRPLAQEVLDLEKRMNALAHKLTRGVVESRIPPREAEGMAAVLTVARAMEEIADNARRIAQIVAAGRPRHPVLGMALERKEQVLCRHEVRPGSPAIGKTLGELHAPELAGMTPIAIKRRGQWYYLPPASFVLQRGDLFVCKGPEEKRKLLDRLL